jgi:hypothetical protein
MMNQARKEIVRPGAASAPRRRIRSRGLATQRGTKSSLINFGLRVPALGISRRWRGSKGGIAKKSISA